MKDRDKSNIKVRRLCGAHYDSLVPVGAAVELADFELDDGPLSPLKVLEDFGPASPGRPGAAEEVVKAAKGAVKDDPDVVARGGNAQGDPGVAKDDAGNAPVLCPPCVEGEGGVGLNAWQLARLRNKKGEEMFWADVKVEALKNLQGVVLLDQNSGDQHDGPCFIVPPIFCACVRGGHSGGQSRALITLLIGAVARAC